MSPVSIVLFGLLAPAPAQATETITVRQYLENIESNVEAVTQSGCLFGADPSTPSGCASHNIKDSAHTECGLFSMSWDFDIEGATYDLTAVNLDVSPDDITADLEVYGEVTGIGNLWRTRLAPCPAYGGGCEEVTCADGSTRRYELMAMASWAVMGGAGGVHATYDGAAELMAVPLSFGGNDRIRYYSLPSAAKPGEKGETDGVVLDPSAFTLHLSSPVSYLATVFGITGGGPAWNNIVQRVEDSVFSELEDQADSEARSLVKLFLKPYTHLTYGHDYSLETGLDLSAGSTTGTILADDSSAAVSYTNAHQAGMESWDLTYDVEWDGMTAVTGTAIASPALDPHINWHFGIDIPDGHILTPLVDAYDNGAYDGSTTVQAADYSDVVCNLVGAGAVTLHMNALSEPVVTMNYSSAVVSYEVYVDVAGLAEWSGTVNVPVEPVLDTTGSLVMLELQPDWSVLGFMTDHFSNTGCPTMTQADMDTVLERFVPGRLFPDNLELIRPRVDQHTTGLLRLLGSTVDIADWDARAGHLVVYFD